MKRAISNVDIGGIDYLALARQRAIERRESINSLSSDDDWHRLAEAKKRDTMMGAARTGGVEEDDDGWESSLNDGGGATDVAALGMRIEGSVMVTEGGIIVDNVGSDDDDGPRLIW
ncbi:hypothetical protein ACHAXA_003975 [Cyclostephanos tholiformis]|uniref:Uncharacterized protein n=1 Tax=Cyclostephanos tholiformis TaxID=382380 RepID=A0ABD3RBB3_9STRA